ncbi:MAG: ABC transporter substrate-binding protein, partial [Acidocella sp.]|nr:ABC transporter substrate-binding protein [Acidocella sp.]
AGTGFAARYKALDPVIESDFDLSVIGQNSVGFLWATLPPTQQQEVSALFAQFTVASYVSQFSGYAGQKFVLLPTEKTLGARKIVETQLVSNDDSAPVELDYVVADGAGGWKITDILLNGTISQVAVHASDFSGLVSSGDASQLIAALKSKIATLSGGQAGSAGS